MIKTNKYRPVGWALLCCIFWMACTQQRQPCLTPKTAILNVETMHLTSRTATSFTDTGLPHPVFVAVTDSNLRLFFFPQQATFILSLSPVADTARWLLITDTAGTHAFDTLTFHYQRDLQFLSNACGYTYFFNLDSVHTTHHNIDSLRIINTNVTNNVNTKHLQIYIHPDF